MKKRHADKTNILLVNITRLGDMLQATPTIAGMKMENPDSKITVLVEKQFEDVCHFIPNIDEVVGLDLGMTVRSLSREQEGIVDAYEYLTEVVDSLRAKKFDYCLNMSSSAYTALLLKLVGIERNGGWTSDEEGYRVIESDWARLFASSVYHQNRQYNSLNLVDVFRCSADVEKHPDRLLITIDPKAKEYAQSMIAEAGFTNTGPLIAVQAGASQDKRQWAPARFIKLLDILVQKYQARIILTGAKKELPIIDRIKAGCPDSNVFVAAGRTDIPQLTALLAESDILITGDTGPMHVSVAAGTPVVAMFLASAFGFETGPYSPGNLVIQPVIGCGPCNPNKPCAGLECHDNIDPELIAELTMQRLKGDVLEVSDSIADPTRVIVYRSCFDEFGFCDLKPINSPRFDGLLKFRRAYRRMWLDDLAGLVESDVVPQTKLAVANGGFEGLDRVVELAEEGRRNIAELISHIQNTHSPAQNLGRTSAALTEIDRKIEQTGFHFAPLGPLTRMFLFSKENISGSDPIGLASQMGKNYEDLVRRSHKLSTYYNSVS